MLEQALLREQFQSLLRQEKEALAGYDDLAASISDPVLQAQVEQLQREKQRHLRLAERLLEIVD